MYPMTSLLAQQRIQDMHRLAERARLVRAARTIRGRHSRPHKRGSHR